MRTNISKRKEKKRNESKSIDNDAMFTKHRRAHSLAPRRKREKKKKRKNFKLFYNESC